MSDVDEAILRLLEQDGRLSRSALSKAVGVSRATAAEHLDRLLVEGGVDVRGAAHPDLLDIHAMAYLTIEIEGPAEPVARSIAAEPLIPFVSIVTGRSPVSAEIRATGLDDVAQIVARLRAIPGVRQVEATHYLGIVRDLGAPAGPLSIKVDELDRRIVAELERDGRIPVSELAERVGRSPTSTRDRLARLRAGGAVRIAAVVRHRGRGGGHAMGLGVRLAGDDAEVIARVQASDAFIFAARAVGRFDLVLTARGPSLASLHATLESLRGWPGVRTIEPWMHLDVVKERYDRPIAGLAGDVES